MAAKKTAAAAPKPAAPAPTAPAAPEAAAPPVDEQTLPPPGGDAPEAAAVLEQPAEAPPVMMAKPEDAAPAPTVAVPELDGFIAGHERAAQAVDLVVTAISHPDAKPRHHAGVYSGFPITTGALSATYSDGSKH
ncbi:hypothetical protein [Massilia timonae]|uniref:hypothetical protein n=1 Tax=Massilia timonae TaxID=47229 RepID=UPI0028A15C29|nr:hypothetical protein [Massilia timonae]